MDAHVTVRNPIGRETGMVIPAYFSSGPSDDMVRRLLWMTLGDCAAYLPLANVWVVIDGDARTSTCAAEVRRRLEREQGDGFNLIDLPANRGKLGALREGMTALLAARPHVRWLVVRDGDGDHVTSLVPHLTHTAALVAAWRGDTRVMIIGARPSRHRPMGFWRGELEWLLDGLTLDALGYALARDGRALDRRFYLDEDVADLSSGYKVYGRDLAIEVFTTGARYLALSEFDYWHYGPETVPVVEAIMAGASVAEVRRPTWDGQPTSSFGDFRLQALYGELIAWVWARLELPLAVAACQFDSRTRALGLRTIAGGLDFLLDLRRYALEKVRASRHTQEEWQEPSPRLPFV